MRDERAGEIDRQGITELAEHRFIPFLRFYASSLSPSRAESSEHATNLVRSPPDTREHALSADFSLEFSPISFRR